MIQPRTSYFFFTSFPQRDFGDSVRPLVGWFNSLFEFEFVFKFKFPTCQVFTLFISQFPENLQRIFGHSDTEAYQIQGQRVEKSKVKKSKVKGPPLTIPCYCTFGYAGVKARAFYRNSSKGCPYIYGYTLRSMRSQGAPFDFQPFDPSTPRQAQGRLCSGHAFQPFDFFNPCNPFTP